MYQTKLGLDFEIFKSRSLGQVRTALDDTGQIWFVAKDICDVLDVQNTSDAINRLDKDEVQKVKLPTAKGLQSLALVNEPGMYSLVLTSRKPQAKEFKTWLTHDVIPSIREHGGYIYQQEKLNEKDKAQLNDMIDALSQSVSKFKQRWHELNADKRELKAKQKVLKSEIKTQKNKIADLEDYIATRDKMYDDLYDDFVNIYTENKQLKSEKIAHYQDLDIISKDNAYKEPENTFADYYLDKEGFLCKKEDKDNDKEVIDMSDRDGDYDLDL